MGATIIRAANSWPASCVSPGNIRLESGLSSRASSSIALATIARKVDLEIFQPTYWPFSSRLPRTTVRLCQSLRGAWAPREW